MPFATRAKLLRLSLTGVREIIELADTGESTCPRVRELMAKDMSAIDRSFREMHALRRRMNKALDAWADNVGHKPQRGHGLHTYRRLGQRARLHG